MSDTPPRSNRPISRTDGPLPERLCRDIVAGLPEGLAVLGARGVHREVNAALSTLVGWDREELVGAGPAPPYVAPSHRESWEELVSAALRGEASRAELTLVHRRGGELVTEIHASSVDSPEYGGRCAVLLFRDVTEQRRIAKTLGDSESRWRSVVENPFDFVSVIDRQYRYVFVNHVEPGLRLEDLIGKARPLDFVEPQYHPVMTAAFEKAFREGVTTSFDVYSSVLDRWTNTVVGPIFEGSEVTSLCILTRDVTSSKRAEQSVKRSQRLEMIGVIGSGLSRELRGQIEPIIANVSLLMHETGRDSPLRPWLAEAARAASRAGELLNRLSSFERSPPEAIEAVNVTDVAAEVVTQAMEALPPGVRLTADVAKTCPPIDGLSWEIQRAIQNLCDNARRALESNGGEIFVSVSRVALEESFASLHAMKPGAAVKIVVRDTGPGMTQETLAHAFDPFFTTWREHGCAGLGLPMVQAIATRHGGTVLSRSSPGDGTTVELYLPAAGGPNDTSRSLPPRVKKILCIDDEATVLKLTRRVLERAGYHVVTFQFSTDALERLERSPDEFDVVVTDQIMPKLTGLELAAKLLAIAPELPVLLVSGFCDPDLVTPPNVRAYLQKPVPVETLLRAVETACDPR